MILTQKNITSFKDLCATHNVDTMYLFGSALTPNFNKNSDIDFLVKFKPIDLFQYFDNYINLKESLQKLFGREVDLVEEQTLKNPILIKSINKSKELVYG
ncbi:MAG: nucleotidyltransferase domain-containing protein [Flavobacteriaceae bacterium]